MKNKLLFISLISIIILSVKDVYAFDSNNYKNRNLCDKYEVAGFHSDGVIDTVSCHSTYEEAYKNMKSNGARDLAILTKINGETKIIDANVALLDLSVNPETLTYFYTNKELTGSAYTYMDTGSLYGGVDGAHIETAYSDAKGTWTAKVKTGNFTGWIQSSAYEIVPITWVQSVSSYTVTNSDIRHNYVAKIQNTYNGSSGRTIGPKPGMLNEEKYYSFDGHYFYTDLEKMIKDYKNGDYTNSVNKNNPYYNYYMYLSNHTKTAYSSINIDEYIRNNLGYKENVYGNSANGSNSRLYGSGTFFYYAQEKYGVNAILSLSLSRNETANGTSYLAVNKNNGFGLNAVDSNPINGANWYASFSSSILGYASKWITYGYAHPRDWRYFGPQFGDKWIGMNVKYASDTYWSEKMAANYYSLDKALGLQDYNYYQLGVVTGVTNAYQSPSTSSKFIYEYPEKEDAVVIVGEETINNEKWYKVVSDLNIDSNYNEITSGDYNWNSYVYVKASQVVKINEGKNGYVSPTNVYKYKNSDYTYDLYIEGTELKPKVAITTKNTDYYYDSSLSSKTGKTLLKDRYVMVYTAAYDNGMPVAYLVTSDYFHDQKEWIKAEDIVFTDTTYGLVNVTVSGNCYTWVNYNTEDEKYSLISGLYSNTYVPVLESIQEGNNTWYKVPVNLTGNNNVYGYTLSSAPGVSISTNKSVIKNTKPTITANDVSIDEGDEFDPKIKVTAQDQEDGNITGNIEVVENTVNTNVPGTYKVTYKVTDSKGESVTKTITVTVKGIEKETKIENNKKSSTEIDKLIENSNKGEFNLESLTFNKESKEFIISGYLINLNQNNNNKEYTLVFINKDTNKIYKSKIVNWTEDTPYDLGEENGNSYTNSWFKGKIDFTDIPNGDYALYMMASNNNDYTIQIVNNYANQDISRRGEDDEHGYNFRVQQKSRAKEISLSIRNELFTTSEAPTSRNMVNGYDEVSFKDNKLYLFCYSYDYTGVYDNSEKITRKLLLENSETYKLEIFDLGSNKGPFEIETLDNKDKTYAWYEKEIDVSSLEKGTYTLNIYTKTSNAENYDELSDKFRMVDETTTINGKTYTVKYNKDRANRIELIVE